MNMQEQPLPAEIERLVLFFVGGCFAYLILGWSFVERWLGETALGVQALEYINYFLATLTGVVVAAATEYLYVFYKKRLNNTSDDSPAPMQDDPPEDEFDGMLDNAPSTGPHMPEEGPS